MNGTHRREKRELAAGIQRRDPTPQFRIDPDELGPGRKFMRDLIRDLPREARMNHFGRLRIPMRDRRAQG